MIKPAIEDAIRGAQDTRMIRVGSGAIAGAADVFIDCFGASPAVIVADAATYDVAGAAVEHALRNAGVPCRPPFVFAATPAVYADYETVMSIVTHLRYSDAIPVAVGSGTINDIVKLASHLSERRYMVVATAASMDGYTAFGASISHDGYKQTFSCPAPVAVVADTDIVTAAPAALTASGYADLLAKVTAGADWIVADALGAEAIYAPAWHLVQDSLRRWTGNPRGIAHAQPQAVERLTEGLLITGLAMQAHRNSRPASGAEHQFSHLWEMEHLEQEGVWLSHGFKVGIGTVAVSAMYDQFLMHDFSGLDVDRLIRRRPTRDQLAAQIAAQHTIPVLRQKSVEETLAKVPGDDQLRARLTTLRSSWGDLQGRLRRQLLSPEEIRSRLHQAGCPSDPATIGVDQDRLHRSYHGARQIRRRYTVLDTAMETGVFDACVDRLFAADGYWRAA